MSLKTAALAGALGLVVPLAWLGGCNRCQRDDPPPPLPTTTADASSEPVVTVLEAGPDVIDATGDADADAPTKKPGPANTSSLKKCCAAIAQNAENAPEPTKSLMKQAAAACQAAASAGNTAAVNQAARQYGITCK